MKITNVKPSHEFKSFVQAALTKQCEARMKVPSDVFERSLFAAAEFDWFNQTGQILGMIDGGGLPRDEAKEYSALIKSAIKAAKVL